MRFGVMLVVAALGAPAAASPMAPRPGKVVRVERAVRRVTGVPRFCAVTVNDHLRAYCFGQKPEVDEHITILDTHHVVGTVRVAHADTMGTCKTGSPNLWEVRTEALDELSADADAAVFGLIDIPIGPSGAHVVTDGRPPPAAGASAESVLGIDANGDGSIDFEFVGVRCEDAGTTTANGAAKCLEVWADPDGSSPQLLRTDALQPDCF